MSDETVQVVEFRESMSAALSAVYYSLSLLSGTAAAVRVIRCCGSQRAESAFRPSGWIHRCHIFSALLPASVVVSSVVVSFLDDGSAARFLNAVCRLSHGGSVYKWLRNANRTDSNVHHECSLYALWSLTFRSCIFSVTASAMVRCDWRKTLRIIYHLLLSI